MIGVEMLGNFRQRKAAAVEAILDGLRHDIFDGDESVDQLAGILTSGKSDPFALSAGLIYAALEGKRKFGEVNVSMLTVTTGRHATLDAMNFAAGYLPPVKRPEGRVSLAETARLVKEFGEFLAALSDAQDPHGQAGMRISREEAAHTQRDGMQVVQLVCGLLEEMAALACGVRDGRAGTLADAEKMA